MAGCLTMECFPGEGLRLLSGYERNDGCAPSFRTLQYARLRSAAEASGATAVFLRRVNAAISAGQRTPQAELGIDSNLSSQRDCGVRGHGPAGQATAPLGDAKSKCATERVHPSSIVSLDISAGSAQWPACGAESADRNSAVAIRVGLKKAPGHASGLNEANLERSVSLSDGGKIFHMRQRDTKNMTSFRGSFRAY
jgi:hypothetical protein